MRKPTINDLLRGDDYPGEYEAQATITKRSSTFLFFSTRKSQVIKQTFKVKEFEERINETYSSSAQFATKYRFEFGPVADVSLKQVAKKNEVIVSQNDLEKAFKESIILEDGNIGVKVSASSIFIEGWVSNNDSLIIFDLLFNFFKTPRQYGKNNIYLIFNQENQLIKVKVKEKFDNKTAEIFLAKDLITKTSLVEQHREEQKIRKKAEDEASEKEMQKEFMFS